MKPLSTTLLANDLSVNIKAAAWSGEMCSSFVLRKLNISSKIRS